MLNVRELTNEEHCSALENAGDMDPQGIFDEDDQLIGVVWYRTSIEKVKKAVQTYNTTLKKDN